MRHRTARRRLPFLVTAAALIALVVPMTSARGATPNITLNQVRSGLQSLTQVTNAGDGTGRLFLVERRGVVRALDGGTLTTFMDIRSIVDHETGGERGLLGLAFHPNFETNHRLYVYYTRVGGDIFVARYLANASNTAVLHSTRQTLLWIEHSAQSNHNGGAMAFGPDGYLYLGDRRRRRLRRPVRNGQSKTKNLLGKILRIDVDGTGAGPVRPLRDPARQPVRRHDPALDEIWAYGLRNPWRISFDRVRPARCSSPTSARAATRRSTASRRVDAAAGTTAGA